MLQRLKTQRVFDKKALAALQPEAKTLANVHDCTKRIRNMQANKKKTLEEGMQQFREHLREAKEA